MSVTPIQPVRPEVVALVKALCAAEGVEYDEIFSRGPNGMLRMGAGSSYPDIRKRIWLAARRSPLGILNPELGRACGMDLSHTIAVALRGETFPAPPAIAAAPRSTVASGRGRPRKPKAPDLTPNLPPPLLAGVEIEPWSPDEESSDDLSASPIDDPDEPRPVDRDECPPPPAPPTSKPKEAPVGMYLPPAKRAQPSSLKTLIEKTVHEITRLTALQTEIERALERQKVRFEALNDAAAAMETA